MKLLRLIANYVVDFVLANLSIARDVLSPNPRIEPETIELETWVRTPGEVLALSNLITFTPGTLALEVEPSVDGEPGRLVVHVLKDADKAAASIRDRLEGPLLDVTRKGGRNAR